jgi:DNA-binding transcriptional ArsR family regulator
MIDMPTAKKIAGMLAAVGEPTRMRVLLILARGPHNVGQLADAIGIPMVNMSHHLGVMRTAGLLDHDKDGRRVIYSLRPSVFTPGGAGDVIGTLALGDFRLTIVRGPDDDAAGNDSKKANGRKKSAGGPPVS